MLVTFFYTFQNIEVVRNFYLPEHNAVYPVADNRRFGGTCRLHLQVRKQATQETNTKQAVSQALLVACFMMYFD
jgi:hypothetical protein